MRTLWSLLLLAATVLVSGVMREARACDLQVVSGSACEATLFAPFGADPAPCVPIPCGPVAAAPTSDDADGDHDGSNQGPERVDSDATIGITVGLDAPASGGQPHRLVPEIEPETPETEGTQQPPRR